MVALFAEKRFWWFAGVAALALGLAFAPFSDLRAIWFVTHFGYWMVLFTFGIFLWSLARCFWPQVSRFRDLPIDWATLGMISLCGTILLVHEAFGFKIIMDEIMLLGTSMSMHLDKTVLVPERGNDIQGSFVILGGILDKRPLFFPFLLSCLHDLLGYRPGNAFVLNGILTFSFLGVVYTIVRRLAGRLVGWLVLVLLAGLPLLAQNATGGGFELLNVFMIAVTLLLGARYLELLDGASLVAFCYSALLLAQVRYESVIYLLPVALIVVWGWVRRGVAVLPWELLLAPLLMVHYPLQHRIFTIRDSSWEMMSKPGYTVPFSARYIVENLYHAFAFFFGRPTEQPNSLVLSALTLLAVPFFALLVMRRWPVRASWHPLERALYFFIIGFAAQFLLLMCYFWGKFDDPVISRLSLPTILCLVLILALVLAEMASAVFNRLLLALAALGLLAVSVPSMSARAYEQNYIPAREVAWRRQFMADYARHDYFVIDNDMILWLTHKVSATSMPQAQLRRDSIVFHFRNHTFSDFFVFQRFEVDPDTGKLSVRSGDDLGPDFVLEPVREARLGVLTLSRISRLKEIRVNGQPATVLPSALPPVPKDAKLVEKLRGEYLENFIKQLP